MSQVSADISMDLSVTADGELVLMHDDYVDRTTDGCDASHPAAANGFVDSHGLLCEMNLDEVQRLDAGSWFSNDFNGERIPTLKQVVNAPQ